MLSVASRPVVHRLAPHIRAEVDAVAPMVRSVHWGDECWMSVRLLDDAPGDGVWEHVGPISEWRRGPRAARFYPVAGWHHGGFEVEVELAEGPASNRLEFAVASKGLAFHYQHPDLDGVGGNWLDEMVGSYAVYHESKRHNEYRAGKAFHIPRPWAEDAAGTRVWCDLLIDGDRMAITIPQDFLTAAVYPVLVDPTIGYTTVGGTSSNDTSSTAPFCSLVGPYTAAVGDTITKIHVYRQDTGGGGASVTVAMYSIVAGFPSSKLAADAAISGITTTGWYDTGTISQALSNGVAYDVANGGFPAGGTNHFYDLGAGTQRSIHNAVVALPASWTDNGAGSSRMVSMYADYAPGGPPGGLPAVASVGPAVVGI